MSILGNIFGRIFHRGGGNAADAAPAQPSTNVTPSAPQPTGTTGTAGTSGTTSTTTAQAAPAQPAPAQQAPAAAMQQVDVEKVLDDMARNNPQKLNWRTSIVDLMKLVGMNSTLQERKELADELGYTGDKSDSATMNIWLHKQVMRKLAENGGKVPADLKD